MPFAAIIDHDKYFYLMIVAILFYRERTEVKMSTIPGCWDASISRLRFAMGFEMKTGSTNPRYLPQGSAAVGWAVLVHLPERSK
jgi:hypothetical protein